MERITKNKLQELLNDVNYLLNRSKNTLKITQSNGITFIREVETERDIFSEAVTKKELYISLKAFRKGLHAKIDE